MPIRLVAAVLVLAAIAAAPARAATLYCDVAKTPEGFTGLHEKPSAKGRVIHQMKPGDEVQLLAGSRGKWVEVLHWRGQDRKSPARAGDTRRGWMQARFLGPCG